MRAWKVRWPPRCGSAEVAHEVGVPVVLTEVSYQNGGIDGGRFFEKVKPLRAFV